MNNASVTQLSFGCEDNDNKDKNIFEIKVFMKGFPVILEAMTHPQS